MATLGIVSKNSDGSYSGTLDLITIQTGISFKLNTGGSEKAPQFKITAGAAEIGAAWIKTSRDDNKPYVTGKLAHPQLGQHPIYFNLGKAAEQDDEDVSALIWNSK